MDEVKLFGQRLSEPREILKRALSLVKDIDIAGTTENFLDAPDISRLKRNIKNLKMVNSEPARKLLDLLHLEQDVMERAAKEHHATPWLNKVLKQLNSPALILLISEMNHDAEIIAVNAERLSRTHHTVVPLYVNA